MKVVKHVDVGEELNSTEFHGEELHVFDSGTTLPESPEEGDIFLKTDEHRLYIYIN